MLDLDGKLALVIGGAAGFGNAIARKPSARGARVILNLFRSPENGERSREDIAATGVSVEIVRASLYRREQVARMFAEIQERHGRLDILINDAAASASVEAADQRLDRAFDDHLKGAFWCAQHASVMMAKRGGGSIVTVSRLDTSPALRNSAALEASKAALESLTRYLAAQYAPLNIRVNATLAIVGTDAAGHSPEVDRVQPRVASSTPPGPAFAPDDLADAVMFLTSAASRWIVGQTIIIDGGMSLDMAGRAAVAAARTEDHPPREATAPVSRCSLVLIDGKPDRTACEVSKEATTEPGTDTEDVAIVGIGLVVPGAADPHQLWNILMSGPELFETVPAERWRSESFYARDSSAEDKNYSLLGAFVKDSPAEDRVEHEDGSVRWLRRSLAQAMLGVHRRDADRFSFNIGYTTDGNQRLEESYVARGIAHRFREAVAGLPGDAADKAQIVALIEARLQREYQPDRSFAGTFLPEASGRSAMSGLLPDDTELLMIDTACASSLHAVDIGMKGLLMGKCEIAVCAGAFALGPLSGVLFSKLRALSREGVVRALDQNNDGTVLSEGAAVVVLKRLHRARQDGDRVWGIIKACASSSNGKGKAVHASALPGQRLVLRRAQGHPAYRAAAVDWVLAHAAGTAVGDRIELEALSTSFSSERKLYVTSNKSVIGHTSRAAGIISLIQAVLALEHEIIAPQHRYRTPPADSSPAHPGIEIPITAQAWVRHGAPRHAAVSSFGFGGTNAHLLLSENDPDVAPTPKPPRPYAERIALIAWAVHVPSLSEHEAIEQWLRGERAGPAASFGTHYPEPGFEHVRMPPKTVRSIDRTQLMVLACAQALRQRLPALWDDKRESAGVFLGHMGKTRQAILHGHRVYLDDIYRALTDDQAVSHAPLFEEAFQKLRAEVHRLVPPATEDSLAGSMPNVIAARVASLFDLKGLTLACDAGFASILVAFELGARYLKSGELDLAIVGGINGNSDWEAADTLHSLGLHDGAVPAEGAFLFALTRESTARQYDLPVVAYVYSGPRSGNATTVPAFDCGLTALSASPGSNYMGAEGALAVLRALHGGTEVAMIRCRGGGAYEDRCLRLERPARQMGATANADIARIAPSPAGQSIVSVGATDSALDAGSLSETRTPETQPGPGALAC